jgi:hypothetical protein
MSLRQLVDNTIVLPLLQYLPSIEDLIDKASMKVELILILWILSYGCDINSFSGNL